ncbi:MAG: hypothetical protein WBA44_13460 [Mesorhizobium sp.]
MSDAVGHDTLGAEGAEAMRLIRRVALIALLSIGLGFVIQGLILTAKLWGGVFPASTTVVSDLTHGITWSLLICVGVGMITALSKARPAIAGALSLLAAPLAVAIAKASQKMMAGLIDAADQQAALSLSAVAGLRAIEYGVLGWLLAALVQKSETRASRYFGVGGAVGVVFGGAIAWFAYHAALTKGLNPGTVQIVSSIINEVVFPLGCAGIIYAAQFVSRSASLVEKARAATS